MRRALIFAVLFCASVACASPLLLFARPVLSPSRMAQKPGNYMLPHLYTQGGEKGFTICWWVRWECPEYDRADNIESGGQSITPALFFQGMNSVVPAKPTTLGGQALNAFFEADKIELDANGAWGMADVIPDNPACFPTEYNPDRYVVCANITTDADVTVTVAGQEKFFCASNEMQIINFDCRKNGDRSIAISAARVDADIAVAFAINEPIHFRSLVHYQADHGDTIAATNVYTFVCIRSRLADGYQYGQFDIVDINGLHDSKATKPEKVDVSAYPKDCLIQVNQMTIYGILTQAMDGSPRRVDVYGFKALNAYITDEQLWRLYDVDRAEIIRRGLDDALPPRR